MIWLFVAVGLGIIVFGTLYDEYLWSTLDTVMASFAGLVSAALVFLILNGICAGVLDQSREYEITKLTAIDANDSLLEINKTACVFNKGEGIYVVPREKCEVVESSRGEIKTTHYGPNKLWTVFTWSDYNRFYVTRDQVSYGG